MWEWVLIFLEVLLENHTEKNSAAVKKCKSLEGVLNSWDQIWSITVSLNHHFEDMKVYQIQFILHLHGKKHKKGTKYWGTRQLVAGWFHIICTSVRLKFIQCDSASITVLLICTTLKCVCSVHTGKMFILMWSQYTKQQQQQVYSVLHIITLQCNK